VTHRRPLLVRLLAAGINRCLKNGRNNVMSSSHSDVWFQGWAASLTTIRGIVAVYR
jgi:hypothetical protein